MDGSKCDILLFTGKNRLSFGLDCSKEVSWFFLWNCIYPQTALAFVAGSSDGRAWQGKG
jgi:hypothetical protein